MKNLLRWMVLLFVVLAANATAGGPGPAPGPAPGPSPGPGGGGSAGSGNCVGKFPNPITDICWSCLLPISLGSMTLGDIGGQEDIENPKNPVCSCVVNPTIGLSIGFWEPARHVEVVRKPFCFVSLQGIELNPGIAAPEAARHTDGEGSKNSFYQAHYYVNTTIYWLKVLGDFPCLEQNSFNLAYITEVDPLWNDDELSLIINPEVVLFANPVAIAACAADCVAAMTGFGLRQLFWCAGCQGELYPLNGNTPFHMGGVRTAELLVERMIAKMHRELITWGWHGSNALCGPYFLPVMDKRAYKLQLTYPIPSTAKEGGKCCQPLGRTTVVWGAGKEYPVKGEDFGFMLFRKRNCCVGY